MMTPFAGKKKPFCNKFSTVIKLFPLSNYSFAPRLLSMLHVLSLYLVIRRTVYCMGQSYKVGKFKDLFP